MDELLHKLDMYFHPFLELNRHQILDEKVLSRNHIKILTYNIFLRPPPIKNNENDWKDERLADFIKLLDNFDIICLQEMFGAFNSRKQELIKYANKSGLFFYCDSPSPSFFSKFLVDGGLLILSRFPIIESEFKPFRYCVLSDSLSNKGVLYAKIKIGDSYIALFNTHLQASYFGSSAHHWNISVKTRLDHIEELCCFIKNTLIKRKINKENTKIMLVGDFNVDAHNYKKKKINLNPSYSSDEEYKILMNKLNEIGRSYDILREKFDCHPFSYGYNGDNLKHYDQVLTAKEDVGSFQTLDYLFEINVCDQEEAEKESYSVNDSEGRSILAQSASLKTSFKDFDDKITNGSDIVNKKNLKNEEKNLSNTSLNIEYESSEVEYFLIAGKPYQQLSDHFGLSVRMSYNTNK